MGTVVRSRQLTPATRVVMLKQRLRICSSISASPVSDQPLNRDRPTTEASAPTSHDSFAVVPPLSARAVKPGITIARSTATTKKRVRPFMMLGRPICMLLARAF